MRHVVVGAIALAVLGVTASTAVARPPARPHAAQPAAQQGAQQAVQRGAQPSPLKRTILQQHALSASGRDGVQALVEMAAGGVAPRHTHNGEELGYIVEGTAVLEVAGHAAHPLKPGDSFFIPAATPHLVRSTGTVGLKLVAVYVVETGKPLATPAP